MTAEEAAKEIENLRRLEIKVKGVPEKLIFDDVSLADGQMFRRQYFASTPGHKLEFRELTIDSGDIQYVFLRRYSAEYLIKRTNG